MAVLLFSKRFLDQLILHGKVSIHFLEPIVLSLQRFHFRHH